MSETLTVDKYSVIWNMDYGQVNKLGSKHPGYCAGMTILWILLRKNNGDFTVQADKRGDPFAKLTDEQVALIQEYQDERVDKGTDAYWDLLEGKIEKAFVAKAVNGAYDIEDIKQIAEIVSAKTDTNRSTMIGMRPTCFYLVRFASDKKSSGKSGHVAAIEVKGLAGQKQKIRFTDIMGISGCLEFDGKDDFAEWLSEPYRAFGGHPMLYKHKIRIQQVIYAEPGEFTAVKMFGLVNSLLKI